MTDLIESWIENKLAQEELTVHGAKLYRAYLRRLVKNMNLTPEQVLEKARLDVNRLWTDAKKTNGMTPAGRHKALLALRNFLRSNGYYPPADRLSHSKSREARAANRKGFLSWNESESVCNSASKPYNLVFRLMRVAGWGASQFLEWNSAENWNKAREYLKVNPNAEYVRFGFQGRKSNDQPFYSLIPVTVLKEIFASKVTLPICTKTGDLPLDHSRYNLAIVYLESAFNTALKRSPIPPPEGRITLHDLRDSYRTQCTIQKVERQVSEFSLGHQIDQLGYDQVYRDEAHCWKELKKLHEPSIATSEQVSALSENYGRQIKDLQEQVSLLSGMVSVFTDGATVNPKQLADPKQRADLGRQVKEYWQERRSDRKRKKPKSAK